MSSWRIGRKLGRTLYRDEVCVGMVDTPELAAEIVEKMNALPQNMPVNSIGTCARCGYHGPGPGHDCKPSVVASNPRGNIAPAVGADHCGGLDCCTATSFCKCRCIRCGP